MSRTATTEGDQRRHGASERHGAFESTQNIARAVVVKDSDLFFLTRPDGDVPIEDGHGFGLYYHDCRFLDGYELRLGERRAVPLIASAAKGFQASVELTNPELDVDGQKCQEEDLGLRWERTVDASKLALYDRISIRNFGLRHVTVPIRLTWHAGFEDVFAVRGMKPGRRGRLHPPEWKNGALMFRYDGADGVYRSTCVHLSPAPSSVDGTAATFVVAVDGGGTSQLVVSIVVSESRNRGATPPKAPGTPDIEGVHREVEKGAGRWLERTASARSESLLLVRAVDRSLRDLHVLGSDLRGRRFFAAGVPWYVTLFGRDSIIACLETLAWQSSPAADTLRLLASYQGTRVDQWREEQPGKILHELRTGEMANLNEIPQTPYYGTVDATPLFLILVARHAAWTGDLSLFRELRPHIDAALEWMVRYGDANGDGYLEYTGSTGKGLANQGWKDSGDSIVDRDGTLATPPISLAEVQGYAYLARVGIADLCERDGDHDRARALRRQAEELRQRFNRDFWMEDEGCYALALQKDGRPAAVVASNAGQVLWSGIAEPDKARRTVHRLMADDMFTGWGIRTLSSHTRRFNPVGYHIGTVWPHDNALIAAGFRRYGLHDEALRILVGIVEAALHFEHERLPEVFGGFSRDEFSVPVRYPVACHPQAWAAGAIPYLLETALGLTAEAFDHRLRVVHPVLPEFVFRFEVRRLRVGGAAVDLTFERGRDGHVSVEPRVMDGRLDVVVEAEAAQRT